MLDLIGTEFAVVYIATLIGLALALIPLRPAAVLALYGGAVAWLVFIAATVALGLMAPGGFGPLPGPVLLFLALLVLLFGAWARSAAFRRALLALPLPVLVAAHIWRIDGVFFLLLYADGRLAAPFAPSAGLGDMITGALALVLVALLALRRQPGRFWLGLWNAFGTLDLVVAITLGALSAPGTPFQLFTAAPGTSAMGTLPWILIPTVVVPILLLLHLAIAVKLAAAQRTAGAAMMAGD
jgi:hypothetical protein